MTKAAIYCRISSDREGAGLGVDRQREDCERLAESFDWNVVDTFSDNDISAYSGKPRPSYRALLAAVEQGKISAIIAWHTDRLHRSPAELEEFIALCEKHSVIVRTVQAGELDLSTPTGQMTARIVGAVARHEIDHARQRMAAAHTQAAINGRPHGRMPYGYKAVIDERSGRIVDRVPDEEQAAIVREIAKRILLGESARSITADLNARKIATSQKASTWVPAVVTAMIKRPTYAGLRSHRGRITRGTWEPLISEEDHRRLLALLNDPTRVTHRGAEPRHLLSGIAKCSKCWGPMLRAKMNGSSSYRCIENNCLTRKQSYVDVMVSEVIIDRLSALSSVEELEDPTVAVALQEARDLRSRLEGFADAAAEGQVSPAALARIEAKLLPQIEAAERRGQKMVNPLVAEVLGRNARKSWERMSYADRRTIVRSLVAVTIHPSPRGRVFHPEFVQVEWL